MPATFTLRVRFLAGRCVAARWEHRDLPEWPPHPARLHMAAVDTLHALGNRPDHRAALLALEQLSAPEIRYVTGNTRDLKTHAVPVNDVAAHAGAGPLTTLEGLAQRQRKLRTFPATILGEPAPEKDCHLAYTWTSADSLTAEHRTALSELFGAVAYLGQSTSPVAIFATETPPELENTATPTGTRNRVSMRVPCPGFLAALESAYSSVDIAYAGQLASAEAALATAKTQAEKKPAETALKKLRENPPPERSRVTGWTTASYGLVRADGGDCPAPVVSKFAADFIVLSLDEGPGCDLRDTLGLTDLLRATAMTAATRASGAPAPRWLCGHEPDGRPSASETPHTAFIPLPFAGWSHADGSIKGLAIVRPRGLTSADDSLLAPLFFDSNGEEQHVGLVAGSTGAWELSRESRAKPPRTLMRETWTAAPEGAYDWATVTPFAFDRMPKAKIERNAGIAWDAEVATIIGEACKRIGLPEPESVQVSTTPWLEGVPPSGDFPLLPIKPGQSHRLLRHLALRFPVPVIGPVLLGAGRFKGYGLLKPMSTPRA